MRQIRCSSCRCTIALDVTGYPTGPAKVSFCPVCGANGDSIQARQKLVTKTDEEKALEILEHTINELEPLWDYCPNRPLGWIETLLSGILQELRWKVASEATRLAHHAGGSDYRQ